METTTQYQPLNVFAALKAGVTIVSIQQIGGYEGEGYVDDVVIVHKASYGTLSGNWRFNQGAALGSLIDKHPSLYSITRFRPSLPS